MAGHAEPRRARRVEARRRKAEPETRAEPAQPAGARTQNNPARASCGRFAQLSLRMQGSTLALNRAVLDGQPRRVAHDPPQVGRPRSAGHRAPARTAPNRRARRSRPRSATARSRRAPISMNIVRGVTRRSSQSAAGAVARPRRLSCRARPPLPARRRRASLPAEPFVDPQDGARIADAHEVDDGLAVARCAAARRRIPARRCRSRWSAAWPSTSSMSGTISREMCGMLVQDVVAVRAVQRGEAARCGRRSRRS